MASELPRFTMSPFAAGRKGSHDKNNSPPQSPKVTGSIPYIPKRFSTAFLLNPESRKPSVAVFHGDLNKEKASQKRKAIALKVLAYVTVLLLGVCAGVAIGHYALPRYVESNSVSSTATTSTTNKAIAAVVQSATDVVEATATDDVVEAQKNVKAVNNNWVKATSSAPVAAVNNWGKQTTTSASSTMATSTKKSTSTSQSSTKSTATSQATSASAAAKSYWQPTAGIGFQLQLNSIITNPSSLPANITAVETDLFDTPVATIAAIKAAGKKVVCYFSAGTAESWRSDYSQFTAADLGAGLDAWAGENWVLTTSTNVRNIMKARFVLAASKGCDAVDADNVDVYDYVTAGSAGANLAGLTTTTSIDYLTFLANEAHALGMAIGLKNAGGVLTAVEPLFQFSVSESCVTYSECAIYKPFLNSNKPAFAIQYPWTSNTQTTVSDKTRTKYCNGNSKIAGMTVLLKHSNLDAWIYQC